MPRKASVSRNLDRRTIGIRADNIDIKRCRAAERGLAAGERGTSCPDLSPRWGIAVHLPGHGRNGVVASKKTAMGDGSEGAEDESADAEMVPVPMAATMADSACCNRTISPSDV
jgi:hypothetical protein